MKSKLERQPFFSALFFPVPLVLWCKPFLTTEKDEQI